MQIEQVSGHAACSTLILSGLSYGVWGGVDSFGEAEFERFTQELATAVCCFFDDWNISENDERSDSLGKWAFVMASMNETVPVAEKFLTELGFTRTKSSYAAKTDQNVFLMTIPAKKLAEALGDSIVV